MKPTSAEKEKAIHSLTTYLPRMHNAFLVQAIRAESVLQYGILGLGKTSKYVISLVMKDLTEKGYFTADGTPVPDAIEKTGAEILKRFGVKL